jgi:hypothetical protein
MEMMKGSKGLVGWHVVWHITLKSSVFGNFVGICG